jgi:Flp pilus assembly protein CpaB
MDTRRRARMILILGVMLALLAGGGTFFYASSAQSGAATAAPTTDVLVAVREIPARTQIAAADLKLAKVNVDAAPPAALKDPKEAIGKILIAPLSINEPVLATKFAPPERAFTVFPASEQVQPGSPHYRIVQLNVADTNASGGIIQAGDKVDLMVVFQFDPVSRLLLPSPSPGAPTPAPTPTPTPVPPGATPGPTPSVAPGRIAPDTIAKIIMGPIEVLARAGTIYTFRVDAAMVERFAYMQTANMTLHLLARHPGDERVPGTTGAYFGTVYQHFKFPLPERVSP